MILTKGRTWKSAVVCLVLLFVMGIMTSPALAAQTSDDINTTLDKTIDYYYAGGRTSDWKYILGLASVGDSGAVAYPVGKPELSKITDVENCLLGMVSAQKDPTAVCVNGQVYDLLQMITDSQQPDGRLGGPGASLNNTIWGVIAFDVAKNNGIATEDYNLDIHKAVNYITIQQSVYGGFDESGYGEDPDSAAHAILAIAPHVPTDSQVITRTLDYLKGKQLGSGGIDNWGENPSSTAAVIEALTALGQDPQGPSWTKDNHNLVDSLLSYQTAQGGFIQDTNWGPIDHTPFVLLALADLKNGTSKYQNGFSVIGGDLRQSVLTSSTLINGKDADIITKVTNNSVLNKPVLVIAALYNSSGKMIQYSYAIREIAAGTNEAFGLGFGLPIGKGFRVKIMVWDSWLSCKPQCAPVIIPIN